MLTVLVHRAGRTSREDRVDPAWLGAGAVVWVDLDAPDEADARVLADVFRFHELAIEDALTEVLHPRIERYDGYLHLVLHGMVAGPGRAGFITHDIDFFLGPDYLVTVRHARSRSIDEEQRLCLRHAAELGAGPGALLHRLVDRLVDHYVPEVDGLEDRLDALEAEVFERPERGPVREILRLKRDIASLRRVALPQRDAIGRLARREFEEIPDALTYRFRDVHDHLVRITDEALFLQDRVTGLLDAHFADQSNRLNRVMTVLTVIATIFMPLSVLTGLYGMNVRLPDLPGGPAAQFWWVAGLMTALAGGMLWMFRRRGWL